MRLEGRISRLENVHLTGRMIVVCAVGGEHGTALRDHGVAPRPIDLVVIVNKPEPIPTWVRIDNADAERIRA